MATVRLWIGRLLLPAMLCAAIAALAAHAVPGRGSVAGHVTVTPAGPGQADLEINAAGIITHLGKSTVNLRLRVNVSGPIPTPVPPSVGVVTAANGDTVTFTVQWMRWRKSARESLSRRDPSPSPAALAGSVTPVAAAITADSWT